MGVTGARIVAAFALYTVTMLVGFIPVFVFNRWKRRQESKLVLLEDERRRKKAQTVKILHLLLVFGGGVLLATCFVHMIPEIQENYSKYMEAQEKHDKKTIRYNVSGIKALLMNETNSIFNEGDDEDCDEDRVPWVEICICLGIFLTYFIEELVLLLVGKDHHHHHETSVDKTDLQCSALGNVDVDSKGRDLRQSYGSSGNYQAQSRQSTLDKSTTVDVRGDNSITTVNNFSRVNDKDHLLDIKSEKFWTLFLRGLIIVVAFLAHSIFDGVAIGLQTTTLSVWTMFFAICLHKLVVVFAISFELFEKTQSLLLTFIHVSIFSIMSPLGIILSILIQDGLSEDGSLTIILLNAVATGAILYIVFLEILQSDKCPQINGLIKLFTLISGFVLMTLLTTLVGD